MIAAMVKRTKNTFFWIVLLVSAFLYCALLLYLEAARKNNLEPFPVVEKASPQVKRLATNVDVGMHIKTFPQFNVTAGIFVLDALVWFRFDKSVEALSTLQNFAIQNSQLLDSKAMMHRSKPIVKLVDDRVLVAYNVQVKFQSSLHYKKFPLEDHRLNIVLVNEQVTPQEFLFNTEDAFLTVSDDIMVEDWKPVGMHAESGYQQSFLDKNDQSLALAYPCVAFSLDFDRVGYRSLNSLYFPLFVLFVIGLLSMMINIFDLTRLGMISASLPMLVLYRLVIDASSPQVAHITHIDFVFYSLVFLSLPIIILQMYVALEGQKLSGLVSEDLKAEKKAALEVVNYRVFLGVMISLVILMTYNFLR